MSKKKTGFIYKVEYSSGMFRERNRDNAKIYSSTKLNLDDFIIVEHIGSGIFIGRVTEDLTPDYTAEDIECMDKDYQYVQKVDLSKFLANKERIARKAELEEQMRERFAVIDEKKKFEYYASLDDEMRSMYEEYKKLGD